jgi:hypothetical protein
VTRDATDLGSAALHAPVSYFSRSKLQSVVSTPTPIGDDIGLASAFQARMVIDDHRKVALQAIRDLGHPLVIDLIDERLGLLRTPTGLITDSLYYRNSAVRNEDHEKVAEDAVLAADGPFAQAVDLLDAALDGTPVVIHAAIWATEDVDGRPLPNSPRGHHQNEWLSRAYAMLEARLSNSQVIRPDPEYVVGDPSHRWGLEAFHYVPGYYDDLTAKLQDSLADLR